MTCQLKVDPRFGCIPAISADSEVRDGVRASVELVERHIKQGDVIYGVNTGVGASSGTRTKTLEPLQKALVQTYQAGVLTAGNRGLPESSRALRELESHALPPEIVRGMMLIRANSLLRGHSGVRYEVVEAILALIAKNITPVVPLRGSISASGDLSPLAYLCGVLEGNSDIYVRAGKSPGRLLSADVALEEAGQQPVSFGPKEALGLLNGTSTSCAAASIAIFQARQLSILVQVLTAMDTEALQGSRQNYHPFISLTRPHPGQAEVASNIFAFLEGSLLTANKSKQQTGLVQDGYPLRTTPQWIGPQLEDLALALQQLQVELNSTTDNPLVDVVNDLIHSCGNFQAASLASAMDKTLSCVQMLGRLVYAQSSELLNSKQHKGLPPSLCADDPSVSITFRGVDVIMSAYMSELAHIAHPVTPFMQSAEEHVQAINSLAFIAARNVLKAIDILSLMASSYLYALCQALDLRCRQLDFLHAAERSSLELVKQFYQDAIGDSATTENLHTFPIWSRIREKWLSFASMDLLKRADATAAETTSVLLEELSALSAAKDEKTGYRLYVSIQAYKRELADLLIEEYRQVHNNFLDNQSTSEYLSFASKIMYRFVREELGVPFHKGLRDHPTVTTEEIGEKGELGEKKTIGTRISTIYESLQAGVMYRPLMEIVGNLEDSGNIENEVMQE